MRPVHNVFWRSTCGALCLAGGVLAIQPSQAAEYGWGNYLLGYSIPMSGYTPPPGVYFTDAFFYYRGSAGNSVTFPLGRAVAAGVTEKFAVNIATLSWFTNAEFLGATFGLAATIPYGHEKTTADASFTGPRVGTLGVSRAEDTTGFGSPAFSAILGWDLGFNHWNLNVTGFVPAGDYEPNSITFVSLNRPSVDVKGAYTWLDMKTGTELSVALGATFNMANTATNYTSGTELHLEFAWQQHLPNGISFGIGGYYYQQVTGDSGSGDLVGSFEGRVAALGPLIGYAFKIGETPLNLSARWFEEFDVTNRVTGHSIFATLTVPLYNPPNPLTAKSITAKY
jgi:hypothetical protein